MHFDDFMNNNFTAASDTDRLIYFFFVEVIRNVLTAIGDTCLEIIKC